MTYVYDFFIFRGVSHRVASHRIAKTKRRIGRERAVLQTSPRAKAKAEFRRIRPLIVKTTLKLVEL